MLIQWSDDDQAFLVTLPEWQDRVLGPVTHGDTYEDAVRNGREVLELLIESAIERGESLPTPQLYMASARS
ncbi:MAG: type II toxin-antitoxin system HicB family antitoxin [Chloroflexota bacterium]|nr:type II toxin-antitoxin system HicB family antitoxin [Chloroflexota bacterium]